MDKVEAKVRVSRFIDDQMEESIAHLMTLIGMPSKMGCEQQSQEYYAGLLKDMGLDVKMWEPQPEEMEINPNFMACRDSYEGSPVVAGVMKGQGGGRSMLLAGHMDVVPEGEAPWTKDPWKSVRENGRIYGRGAIDDKGGVVMDYMALKAIHDAGIKLKGDVTIAAVSGEETGGSGTLSLISHGYRADGALVPEGSNLRIYPASLGVIWFRITIEGKAVHAGHSHLGVSAISKAALIIEALDQCNIDERMALKHPLYYETPNPFNINVGQIEGGAFPTSVPGEVVITGRIATSPREEIDEAKAVLENAVQRAADQDPWLKEHPPVVEWYGFCLNSGETDAEHPLIQTLAQECEQILGNKPEILGAPWGTDAGSMIRFAGIPTVIFGAGPADGAHGVDEYVEEEKLRLAAKIAAATIIDWCGIAD